MSPNDTVQMQKYLKGMLTLLGRWQGGRARLWAFQAAHCQLTIRIERRGERGNLIMCTRRCAIKRKYKKSPSNRLPKRLSQNSKGSC